MSHRAGSLAAEVRAEKGWIGSRFGDDPGSSQPVRSTDGQWSMVVDGQVSFDKEPGSLSNWCSVLDGIVTEGAQAVSRLHGAFAIAALDETGAIFVARDRFGLKPLYWARRENDNRFASEIRAFDSDWLPLVEFFPPGHVWSAATGLVRFAPDIREQTGSMIPDDASGDRSKVLTQIRECLVESVHKKVNGDLSVVAFLSGGLDSSLIAAIASRWMAERGEILKTYAVGMEQSPDLEAARGVADYLQTDHTEVTYTARDAITFLPEVIAALEHFDPSLVRSSVANYLLSRTVAQEADVALTGEGADELFAGYTYLRDIESDDALDTELRELIAGLHQGGLQRVDRTTMAHGLQARMPFLTDEMVDLAMRIPASMKRADESHPEKQLLREAFRGWLPDEFLWRKKAQFGDGSGAGDALVQAISESISDDDFVRDRGLIDPPARTREELAYYRLFAEMYAGARPEHLLVRFATTQDSARS